MRQASMTFAEGAVYDRRKGGRLFDNVYVPIDPLGHPSVPQW